MIARLCSRPTARRSYALLLRNILGRFARLRTTPPQRPARPAPRRRARVLAQAVQLVLF